MEKKTRLLLLVILIIIISLTACKKKEEAEENMNNEPPVNYEEENQENNEDNGNKIEEEKYDYVYPLTGIGTNEDVSNRIVGVMINNHPAARPQSGLSKADLVFEILAEGATTRYLALFQSEMPDLVGPVRSAREYYFELARSYDAIYVYHGAAEFVNHMIRERGIENLNGAHHDNDQKLFKRESFRKAPHNSYLLMNHAYDFAEQKGYSIENGFDSLTFIQADEEITAGTGAKGVRIGYIGKQPYYTVEYTYDPVKKLYNRSSDGIPDKELNGDDLIEVDNIFILETHHEVFDSEGRRRIDFASGGQAVLLQKGRVQELAWENRDGVILPVKDGKVVPFVPGKTWINVVPSLEQSVEVLIE